MKSPTIEFINHASVIISHGNISILSDPWYKDAVFHNGWRLLYELPDDKVIEILKRITHIYISHEHPDHFQPAFFLNKDVKKILLNRKIKILFQNTKDKRVVNFLRKHELEVSELDSNGKINLSDDLKVQIIKCGFYDSALSINTANLKILNLNDCPLRSEEEIKKFRKNYGTFDILLSQFSYAAWKGGIRNKIYRKKAAEEKLENLENQVHILNCKSVIPFASFIYFSNELNVYMNDSINVPENVTKCLLKKGINTIFLQPEEVQKMDILKQNQLSMDFWSKKYNEINLKQKDKYGESVHLKDLNSYFEFYKERIFKKNSKLLIFLLSKIKLMSFFQPLKIKLLDHNKTYRYSVFEGLIEDINIEEYDIKMHSQSLSFIFKNEFGFDTLTVNGCFEANQAGFIKATKILALGNLNAMGFNLNLSLIFHPNIIFSFLNILKKVKKQLKIT